MEFGWLSLGIVAGALSAIAFRAWWLMRPTVSPVDRPGMGPYLEEEVRPYLDWEEEVVKARPYSGPRHVEPDYFPDEDPALDADMEAAYMEAWDNARLDPELEGEWADWAKAVYEAHEEEAHDPYGIEAHEAQAHSAYGPSAYGGSSPEAHGHGALYEEDDQAQEASRERIAEALKRRYGGNEA